MEFLIRVNRASASNDVVRAQLNAALGSHYNLVEASAFIRAMTPAAICRVAPTAQLSQIERAVLICAGSSRTMLETDTNAATEARNVPAALSSITASALVPSP